VAEPIVLENAYAWLGGHAIEGALNRVSFSLARAEQAHNVMGDGMLGKYPGLMEPSLEMSGFWRAGDDGIVYPRMLTPDRTAWPLTICPPQTNGVAPGAAGDNVYTLVGSQFGYELWGKHGTLMPYTLKTLPRSGYKVYRQKIALPRATRIATVTGAGLNLGLLGAGQKLVSVLHVFSVTGGAGSVTVTIESDEDDTWAGAATRITHTAVTTAVGHTCEVKELDGAVATDDWWRAVATWTAGTNYSLAVGLSIQ